MPGLGTVLPPKFDALDPVLLHDPYPTYARLREAGPLCRGGPATWVVTRHADVTALLRDPRVGHEFPERFRRPFTVAGGQPNAVLPRIVSALEPPDHTRVRHLMSKALSPLVVRGMRGRVAERVDELLAAGLERGGLDALGELALPLQVTVACELVGVPPADRPEISRRAMQLGRALILIPYVDPELGNGEAEARWLRDYVAGLVAERRRRPADDLTTALTAVRDGGDALTDDEVVDNLVFLFFAGFETSMHMVANGCASLLRFPDQLARVRADPGLVPSAVEEVLRFDAPIQWIARMTSGRVEVGGRTLQEGRVLILLLASANHDERQYPEPGRLDVGRRPNPHFSFGGGIHHCLGVQLARAQGAIVLERLLARCGAIELAGEPVLRPHPNLRGYASVPVAVRPPG
jgi:cytochrome P450